MRFTPFITLALSGILLAPGAAWAQKPKRTTITADPRIGFQAGMLPGESGKEYLFKPGLWAPVSVDVIVGDEPLRNGELAVDTTDSDEVQNTYSVKLPLLNPGQAITVLTYVKTGSRGGEAVTRVISGGSTIETRKSTFSSMELDDLLFVAVGAPLPGLRRALVEQRKQHGGGADNKNFNQNKQPNEGQVARLETVSSMPRHWFGYQAADLVILTTSNADFVKELINDKPRHQALLEWVLRGGRLVISAGRNHDLLPSLAPEVIEAADSRKLARIKVVPGGLSLRRLPGLENYARQFALPLVGIPDKANDEPTPFTIAHLERKPGKDVEPLATSGDGKNSPILVRVPYGTGQIVLAGFDVDQPPFTRWGGQNEFWKRFQDDLSVALSTQENLPFRNFGYDANNSNDVGGVLVNTLQAFPEVSNISFGWVALFIFVYILVVGPLDYFFLKKVVKRLELTWITFPTVVLIVSVTAYFTAYALKGNDLLINKADLVDIDLEGQTGYGHSWFTLFSPRIQHYTVGLEPAAPVWAKEPAEDDKASTVLLSWMGRPDDSYGGYGRSRSQSLFRRAYNYAPEATGLEGVPIQVWSMKSFEGDWVRPLNPAKPPLVADLRFAKNAGQRLSGESTITNQLPVDLTDVHLIVGGGPNKGGTVYSLDKPLVHDVPQRISIQQGRPLTDWLGAGTPPPAGNAVPGTTRIPTASKDALFRRISFFKSDRGTDQMRNVTLRPLDVTWRLRLKNEVILFARVAPQSRAAEEVTIDAVTPARLWLGKLPAPNESRLPLLGTMTQDTYVRVFIPVKGDAPEE